MMFASQVILVLLPFVLCSPLNQYQHPFTASEPYKSGSDRDPARPIQRIAIIGSGIVGASAAYTLAENARQNSQAPPISITIFEQNAIIGGRITATKIFDQEELTIDTCAATFNNVLDTCVLRLASETGLVTALVAAVDNGTAIWNGEEIVGLIEDTGFRDLEAASMFKRARFEQRYGRIPLFNHRTTTQAFYGSLGVARFTSLEEEVRFGQLNESLVRGACEGTGVLCDAGAESELYLRELVEAGVRDRFFGDYDELNELNSVLGLADENGLISIDGGNLRLIDRLIKLSNARLRLNSRVKYLSHDPSRKWSVGFKIVGRPGQSVQEFDSVIIAAPLSLSGLKDFPGAMMVPELQFADTVVTHFTTKWNLNATYFGTGLPMPQTILTSATANKNGNRADVPFFSLRLLDEFIQPFNSSGGPDRFQKLYKIVSSQNISLADITQFLEPRDEQDKGMPAITWMHREYLPNSVPRLDRAIKIQGNISIADGLFYAGGGAQVADTVEFGCRMGTNAAKLVIPQPVRRQPGNG